MNETVIGFTCGQKTTEFEVDLKWHKKPTSIKYAYGIGRKHTENKEFVDSLDEGVHTRIGEAGSRISGGQRQRIGIARALYKGCDILLFDEATSSLDNKTEQSINNAIQNLSNSNKSLTIVVIAHRESSLEYCHRIITL
jgi:ABC-type bacteriocin/lantibiotic exporter with double-glycine peptidase domain